MNVNEAILRLQNMGDVEAEITVNITVVKQVKKSEKLSAKAMLIEFYEDVVSEVLGITTKALKFGQRKHENVRGRAMLYQLLKTCPSYTFSLSEIGRLYDKDHSTIIHYLKTTFENLHSTEKIFRDQFETIKNKIARIE